MGARHDRNFGPCTQTNDFTLESTPVHPVKNMQTVVIGEGENGAQWRIDPAGKQATDATRLRGGGPEKFAKRLAKAARRFKTMIQLRIQHVDSLSDGSQRRTHAPRPLISLK